MGYGLLNYHRVFSAGRVLQSAVASSTSNPQLGRTSDLERSNSRHKVSPTPETKRANPSSGRWNYGQEIAENFAEKWLLPRHFLGSFTCRKSTTWDRRLYFPSEGRRAEDFFRPKNPTASAGFEPANWGTKASTLTSRPPKPLLKFISTQKMHSLIPWSVLRQVHGFFHSELPVQRNPVLPLSTYSTLSFP